MKKIFALLICFIMLATAVASAVSVNADNVRLIDGRELEEYGQVHYWLGDPVAKSEFPDASDGVVTESEYLTIYHYGPDSPRFIAKVTDSKTGTYTDTEWVALYMCHDGENLYIGMKIKDNAYYPDKDYVMINIGARDRGRTVDAVSRIRYDFRGDATTLITGEDVTTSLGAMWKNNDGSWGTAPAVNVDDHVGDRSMLWDAEEEILTFEATFKIQSILDYWNNDLSVEDARLYFMPIIKMMGDSYEGAGDGPLDQGYLWHYLDSYYNNEIRLRFVIDYPEMSYWMEFFPHVIHLGIKPVETTYHTTTVTRKVTLPTITLPQTFTVTVPDIVTVTMPGGVVGTSYGETSTSPDATEFETFTAVAETTKKKKRSTREKTEDREGSCGAVVPFSALAILPILGAVVVLGKKKDD